MEEGEEEGVGDYNENEGGNGTAERKKRGGGVVATVKTGSKAKIKSHVARVGAGGGGGGGGGGGLIVSRAAVERSAGR